MTRLDTVHPIVKQRFELLQKKAQDSSGIHIVPTQGLRTEAYQHALWCRGRFMLDVVNAANKAAGIPLVSAKDNNIVTWAKSASVSFHGYGLAVDFGIMLPDSKILTWEDKADTDKNGLVDWDEVGEMAEMFGFEWGGNFSNPDRPHLQLRMGWTIKNLIKEGIPAGVMFATAHELHAYS